MEAKISKIDKKGRIELPKKIGDAFGFLPESDVIIEISDEGIFIKPKLTSTPINQRISQMDLPVSEWSQMEDEIEKSHLE